MDSITVCTSGISCETGLVSWDAQKRQCLEPVLRQEVAETDAIVAIPEQLDAPDHATLPEPGMLAGKLKCAAEPGGRAMVPPRRGMPVRSGRQGSGSTAAQQKYMNQKCLKTVPASHMFDTNDPTAGGYS